MASRTTQITTSCSVKVNTGNLEMLEVTKSITVDIQFGTQDELAEKSKKLDNIVISMVKQEVEIAMNKMGRTRHLKEDSREAQVGIWQDFESPIASD